MPAFTPSVVITTQPQPVVTAVKGQDTTLTVEASANFSPATLTYQWKKGEAQTTITKATKQTYTFDALTNGEIYVVTVTALSGTTPVANVTSDASALTIVTDESVFAKFAVFPESGQERFLRLRNLGYV
jgi:hypothetical protein